MNRFNPIIDGDGIVYAISCVFNERYKAAIEHNNTTGNINLLTNLDRLVLTYIQNSIRNIIKKTNANKFIILCRGSNSYRRNINNNYKVRRKAVELPVGLDRVRDILINRYKAIIVEGIETDDACSIVFNYYNSKEMISLFGTPILCHSDKDLMQIPGWHLSTKSSIESAVPELVTEDVALFNLLKQSLMGDSTDNIDGINGVGEAKALDILRGNEVKTKNTVFDNLLYTKLSASKNKSMLPLIVLYQYINNYGTTQGIYEFCTNMLQVQLLPIKHKKEFNIPNYINIGK